MAVVEGLDAEMIAGQKQLLALGIPEGDGEHAIELADAVGAQLGVQVQHCLGVAVGAELVAGRFQSLP